MQDFALPSGATEKTVPPELNLLFGPYKSKVSE
jgi:hypothetical protein